MILAILSLHEYIEQTENVEFAVFFLSPFFSSLSPPQFCVLHSTILTPDMQNSEDTWNNPYFVTKKHWL